MSRLREPAFLIAGIVGLLSGLGAFAYIWSISPAPPVYPAPPLSTALLGAAFIALMTTVALGAVYVIGRTLDRAFPGLRPGTRGKKEAGRPEKV